MNNNLLQQVQLTLPEFVVMGYPIGTIAVPDEPTTETSETSVMFESQEPLSGWEN